MMREDGGECRHNNQSVCINMFTCMADIKISLNKHVYITQASLAHDTPRSL